MKKRSRTLWLILFGVPLLLGIPVAIVGSSICRTGMIDVRVVEKQPGGCSVGIHVPGALVSVLARCTPRCAFAEIREEAGREAENALDICRVVLDELGRGGDGVYVDVRTAEELVTIEKRDGKLLLFVDTPDETVRCSLPIRVLASVISAI